MQYISTINAPQAIGPYSQAIAYSGLVYTSGQIALTPDGTMLEDNITIQTHQVLKNLKEVLLASNSSLDNVIKTTIFLTEMENFAVVNEIYSQYFGEHKPARSTLAVKTLPRNALVEIDAVAIIKV